jgi:arylsulfatase A-like enzyme
MAASGSLSESAAAGPSKPINKPNVVVFYLDDVNPTDGRLLDDPSLTPNLYDLFVKNGIQFDHTYGETPLCCPSRATLFTGLHTLNHGVLYNDARLFDPSENVGKEMTAAGYQSMLIGKYLNQPNLLTPSQWIAAASGWSVFDVMSSSSADSDFQYYYDYSLYTKDQGTLTFGEAPEDHSTRVIGERAVSRLQEADPSKPVFQILTLYNTHAPNIPMPGLENDPRWAACSNMAPWDPPSYNEADMSDKPPPMQSLPLLPYPNGWPMDGYCREMLGVDWVVGQVVNELKAEGRYNNTVFMFTADNGMGWGEHRIGATKQYPYVTRVPLYFSWPGQWRPRTIHEYVSDIDFAPTFCAIGGCTLGPFPGGQTKPDGLSLLPLLKGTASHLARDALLEDNFETRSWAAVRTTPESSLGLWHYIENQGGFIELYDDANDPWELNNLSSQSAYQDLIAELHTRLYQLLAEGRQDKPATVTIVEDSVPNAGQDFSFSGSLGSFSLDDDSIATLPRKKVLTVPAGDYTLTEAPAAGWTLTGISCPFPSTADLGSRTISFHLLPDDNIKCTFTNLRRRPDLSIAQVEAGPYKGDNVYSAIPGPSQTQKRDPVTPGEEYDYFVKVQNDGKARDAFTIKSDVTEPDTMSASFWSDGIDVTADVLAGTYHTASLVPSATAELVVRVVVDPSAPAGQKQVVVVHATSVAEPSAVDVVRAITID